MAGEMERDAKLILRAEDRASRTFEQVAASVKKVRQEIVDQTRAMQDGKGDVTAYNRALDELKASGDDLVRGQSLIRQFESQGEAISKAEQRLKSATAALDAYKAKAGANPTDNQSTQIDKRTNSVANAQGNLDKATAKLDQIVVRMNAAGIATDNLETQFDQMGRAAIEAAQGIAAAKSAIDDYPEAVKRATAAAAEFEAAQQFAKADTSILGAGDFAYIQSLDTAKAKLAALGEAQNDFARREAAVASTERLVQNQRNADLKEILGGNAQLDAQFKELIADEQRLADVKAFRQVGIDAAASALQVEKYGANVQALGNDFQSFTSQVRVALGGTSTGLQDIGQALAQVDASTELLAGGTKRINELQASTGQLSIAIATLDRTARQIDGFRQLQQSVASAEATFAEAQAEVLRLARAVGEADAPVDALENELNQAQRALTRAGEAMQSTRNEAVKMSEGLRQAGINTDKLDSEMTRIAASAGKAGDTFAGLNGKLKGKGGLFGLNAFEVQNLGFQINDVITQLSLGQGVFRTLASQGGQIVQLFQGFVPAFIALLPVILPVAAALGVLYLNFQKTLDLQNAVKGFTTQFALMGDAAGLSAQQFGAAQIALEDLGVKADDAKAALRTFIQDGFNPAGLDTFLETVKAISDATGIGFPEAATKFGDALSGGFEQVQALNDVTHTLTDTQLEEIQTLFDAGDAQAARTAVAELYRIKAEEIAEKSKGPWKRATEDLTKAYSSLNTSLGLSKAASFIATDALNDVISILNALTVAARAAGVAYNYALNIKARSEASILTAGGLAGDFDAKLTERRKLLGLDKDGNFPPQKAPKANASPVAGQRQDSAGGRRFLAQQETELKNAKLLTREERLRTAEVDARRKAEAAGGSNDQVAQAAANARKIEQSKLDKEDATKARKGASAANKAARAAETLANQRRSIEEALVRDLDGLEAKVDRNNVQSLDERLAAVDKGYTALFQKIAEFKRKGGTTIDGKTVSAYEDEARAQLTLLKNQEQMKFYEESITAAVKARADQIKIVEDQRDRGDITPADATTKVEEIVSSFAPKIAKLNTDAIGFAKNLTSAVPNPKLEAFVSKFERLQQENSGDANKSITKAFAQGVISDEAAKLDGIIKERDQLVAAENTLVELGVKTRTEAQGQIEAAYARTTPLIQQQSLVMQGLLDSFIKANPEMQTFYDTWKAKLAGIAAQATYVDARYTSLKNNVDNLITGNAVKGIDNMAQAFARLALGQQSALKTLGDLGLAFAGFIADTIIGLAKLIIQMLILSAIEKVTGIPVGALLKFFDASGLHTGGVVGQEKTFGRRVPAAAFANAPRYHGGGVAGFAPDEVPAILKRNEEVLTQSDPRHRFNLGGDAPAAGAEAGAGQRNILVLDPAELANAMAGPAGEKVTIQHIRRNKTTLAQVLGNGK